MSGAGTTALAGSTGSSSADLSPLLEAPEVDEKPATQPAGDGDKPGGTSRLRRSLIRFGVTFGIAILAAVLLRMFVVQPYYIPSESMEPTLHGCTGCNDDHVLVDKFSYRIHDPRQGDIVVFHRPAAANPDVVPEDVLIKRVIALGGDTIEIKKGRVFVNNGLLSEDYLNDNHTCYPTLNYPKHTVPAGDVFVMGDNRCNSIDSRTFGPVSDSSIIGRAFARIWPINKIGFLKN
jgi:signal peptidase I